jgi:hypothetical protein
VKWNVCAGKWWLSVSFGYCISSDRLRKAINCQLISRCEFEPRKSFKYCRLIELARCGRMGWVVESEWEVVIWPESVRNEDLRRGDDDKKSNVIFCHITFEFASHTNFIII